MANWPWASCLIKELKRHLPQYTGRSDRGIFEIKMTLGKLNLTPHWHSEVWCDFLPYAHISYMFVLLYLRHRSALYGRRYTVGVANLSVQCAQRTGATGQVTGFT